MYLKKIYIKPLFSFYGLIHILRSKHLLKWHFMFASQALSLLLFPILKRQRGCGVSLPSVSLKTGTDFNNGTKNSQYKEAQRLFVNMSIFWRLLYFHFLVLKNWENKFVPKKPILVIFVFRVLCMGLPTDMAGPLKTSEWALPSHDAMIISMHVLDQQHWC